MFELRSVEGSGECIFLTGLLSQLLTSCFAVSWELGLAIRGRVNDKF